MPQIYAFQSFQLNVRERQLSCEGRVIRLHAKVFDTLVVLISDAGRLLRKEVLMKAIWPDHVVEENNLQHNICVLRRVLEQHGGCSLIETVPGQGYRFHGEVEVLDRPFPVEVQALPRNGTGTNTGPLRFVPRHADSARGLAAVPSRFWLANRANGEFPAPGEADQMTAMLERFDELRHCFRALAGELAEIEQYLEHNGMLRADRQVHS
jgi:DNA-binding winged helix-turn-helix (wHTH) protein